MRFASRRTFEIQSALVIECNARVGDNARLFQSFTLDLVQPHVSLSLENSMQIIILHNSINLNHTAYLRFASSFFCSFYTQIPLHSAMFQPCIQSYAHLLDMIVWPSSSNLGKQSMTTSQNLGMWSLIVKKCHISQRSSTSSLRPATAAASPDPYILILV